MATISSTMPVTASRRNARMDPHVSSKRGLPFVWSLCAASTLLLGLTGCGSNDTAAPSPVAPSHAAAQAKTFSTFQAASVVVGQADFTSNLANRGAAAGANTLTVSYGNPAVGMGRLYVPDNSNARVLGYTTVPTTNGAAANFVLGQPDFTTTSQLVTATGMFGPQTVVIYQGKLLVVDWNYNRVLIWNSLPTTTQAPADVVVGQPDMTNSASGCTNSTLANPESIAVVNGSLIVADGSNHRVLVWNTIPITNGAAADMVGGQPDFTTCSAPATPSATSFAHPSDIASNGTQLALADPSNNRVLIWNTIPSCTPTPCAITTAPDIVLGQPDFTSATANNGGISATSLSTPFYLATDGTRLAVSDSLNNRVLIWNQYPSCTPVPCASTTPPAVVLGQPDFVSSTANNDGFGGSSVSAQSLKLSYGVFFNGPNQLIVVDSNNSRILIFNAQ